MPSRLILKEGGVQTPPQKKHQPNTLKTYFVSGILITAAQYIKHIKHIFLHMPRKVLRLLNTTNFTTFWCMDFQYALPTTPGQSDASHVVTDTPWTSPMSRLDINVISLLAFANHHDKILNVMPLCKATRHANCAWQMSWLQLYHGKCYHTLLDLGTRQHARSIFNFSTS